jgi:excisionase family DNA binding protein
MGADCADYHKRVLMMTEMLTAKDVQALLQVDRTTVYRMAEDGRLPAVKIGKQWRFSAEQLQQQLGLPAAAEGLPAPEDRSSRRSPATSGLKALLPVECVQLMQNNFADLLGVMLVVTDMDGRPLTQPSHTCGLFDVINETPGALQSCMDSWRMMAQAIDLEPRFSRTHLGLLCGRAMIRVGAELQGMVVAGCVAPAKWPPTAAELALMAADLGLQPEQLAPRLDQVFFLSQSEQQQVLVYLQRIAAIIAHIVHERKLLMDRLAHIAELTQLS